VILEVQFLQHVDACRRSSSFKRRKAADVVGEDRSQRVLNPRFGGLFKEGRLPNTKGTEVNILFQLLNVFCRFVELFF
jgi:hypothetical protein